MAEKQLFGKRVLITGASSGIGASLATYLAAKGLHVILCARREERLNAIARDIRGGGGICDVFIADLSIAEERMNLFKDVTVQVGEIDILINNAGFGWYGYFTEMPYVLAEQMVAVNILSAVQLTKLFLPGMLTRGNGHIINVSSIAGGLPNQGIAVYSGSKAFLDAFSTSLYREYHQAGVINSGLRLGPVETEFFDQAREKPSGRSVPAEKLAISTKHVNRAVWRLLRRPRRVRYVPRWLWLSKHVEPLFGPLIDQLGPVLLRKRSR